ncbi:MAG: DUF6709 family protein [Lachnospiraceae bacterium]
MKALLCRLGLGFLVFGAVFLYLTGFDAIASLRPAMDLYAEDTDIKKVTVIDHIETEFDMSLGCFVKETSTTTKNGSTISSVSTYIYAIPVFSEGETYWIGLEVNEKDRKKLEKITDETWAYLTYEDDSYGYTTYEVEGRLKKMDKSQYKYMVEFFEELNIYDDEEIEKYVLPKYVDSINASSTRVFFYISLVLVFVMGIPSLIGLILEWRYERKKAKAAKELMNYDYQSGGNITINGVSYDRNTLAIVEEYVRKNEKVFASKELQKITGLELSEARKVVDNWGSYCRQ